MDDQDSTPHRRDVLGAIGGVAAGTALTSSRVQPGRPAGGGAPTTQTPPDTPPAIEGDSAELSTLVEDRLEDADVPGAAVTIVVDGEVVLAAGYGEAEPGRPADATTPFRIASVSKPVVGTAVAELAARGDVDLEAPISEYVDDNLVTWDQPVTLSQLMTHTGGFDMTNWNLWYPSPEQVRPLSEHLTPMPPQVREPGTLGSYSNHGVALAGQVVAAVTGRRFAAAMDELLFDPAGMPAASFAQPLPEDVAEAHAVNPGLFARLSVRGKLAGLGISPAGAMSATAAGMARFLSLHLNGGRIDGEQVLDPAAVELAQQQWFTHHEAIDGMALGFVEDHHGETRILTHDGFSPTDGFASELRLVPDHGIGVFTAYNGNALSVGLADAIVDELLSEPSPETRTPTQPDRADELTGTYRSLRRGTQSHDSLFTTLQAPSLTVSIADDGAILIDDRGDTSRWIQIEPLVFEREDSTDRVAFGTDPTGEITRLFVGGQSSAFVETDWYESNALHGGVFLTGVLGTWWGFKQSKPDRHREESRREWLTAATADPDRSATLFAHLATGTIALFLFLLLGYTVAGNTRYFVGYLSEPAASFTLAHVLSVAGAVSAVGVLAMTGYVLVTRRWSWRRRLSYALIALILAATTWLLWYWNLLLP